MAAIEFPLVLWLECWTGDGKVTCLNPGLLHLWEVSATAIPSYTRSLEVNELLIQ